jgi:hypothetical protein
MQWSEGAAEGTTNAKKKKKRTPQAARAYRNFAVLLKEQNIIGTRKSRKVLIQVYTEKTVTNANELLHPQNDKTCAIMRSGSRSSLLQLMQGLLWVRSEFRFVAR